MQITPGSSPTPTPAPAPAPAPAPTSPFAFLNSSDPLVQVLVSIGEALLILLVSLILAGLAKSWVVRLLTRSRVNLNVATLVGNLAQVGVVLFGIVTALPVVGVQWASLVAILSVAGLAISLSLQDLLKNVVAGVYILMEQPFRIGDRISIMEVTGVVQGIELRTTILRTDDQVRVVVPNNTVLTEIITNRSTTNLLKVVVQMRIRRSADTGVSSQAFEVVTGIPDIAPTPPPLVAIEGIYDGIERLRIEFWVPATKKVELTAAVVEALQAKFPEANLKVVA